VIVDDFNLIYSSLCPTEENPILVIDSNAVLALPGPFQSLQAVPREDRQIFQVRRRINLIELSKGSAPELSGASAPGGGCVSAVEDIFGGLIDERPDHGIMIARIVCYCKSIARRPMPNGLELSGPAKTTPSEIAELAGSAPASG
jgi:hypothetical protein